MQLRIFTNDYCNSAFICNIRVYPIYLSIYTRIICKLIFLIMYMKWSKIKFVNRYYTKLNKLIMKEHTVLKTRNSRNFNNNIIQAF